MSTDKNTFTTVNPATEEKISTHTYMAKSKAFKAVEDCHKAYLNWRKTPIEERAKIIIAIGKECVPLYHEMNSSNHLFRIGLEVIRQFFLF